MKPLRIIVLFLGLSACAALSVYFLTDWNDHLFLPLALFLSAAANGLNYLAVKREKLGEEEVE